MRKLVVFNVGGAFSSFMNLDGKRIMIDVGKSEDFNPVTDFLVPLYNENGWEKNDDGKYAVEQLIVTHPHFDHISAIVDFDDSFAAELLTCPNDHPDNSPKDKLDFSQFDESSVEVKTLRKMCEGRALPLRTYFGDGSEVKQYLFYLKPGDVSEDDELTSGGECYQNNVSLVSMFKIGGSWVLFPGDIMKHGIKKLINDASKFQRKLKNNRVDILVAPHHGLKSSFCQYLFDTMKDSKVRCLNIIPEKPSGDDKRKVDSRYYSSEYCDGENDLESTNGEETCCGKKTSCGHVCIDFGEDNEPSFKVINDSKELIDWFCEE